MALTWKSERFGKGTTICLGSVVMVGITVGVIIWLAHSPRSQSLKALGNLNASLSANDPAEILKFIAIPQAIAGRAPHEQAIFARKALMEELSAEGLAALPKVARFGPLLRLFPQEGPGWAKQAGVKPENCVAFKAERGGIRTEVVLYKAPTGYQIVRCNNVRQLDPNQVLTR